jgi:hypothetical protein
MMKLIHVLSVAFRADALLQPSHWVPQHHAGDLLLNSRQLRWEILVMFFSELEGQSLGNVERAC